MNSFSLDEIAKDIHFSKTRTYFREVLSSYQNENYRSAVVMLWSVAVCDMVYKLESLIEIYNDKTAQHILSQMSSLQEKNPTSSDWEIKLLDDVFKTTQLLESPEYENLRTLQKQRHLSAHPILNKNRELHSPNKDTARALLRNTLEGLLIKPPFYTNKILEDLLKDLAESAQALNTKAKVRQYIESRYLRRLKPQAEIQIFRSFWKLAFKLDDENCKKFRKLNLNVLECISARHITSLAAIIRDDHDYYGNISSGEMPLTYITYYFANHRSLHDSMPQEAKLKIAHHAQTNDYGKVLGWFIKDNLQTHYDDLLQWISGESYLNIDDELWPILESFEDSQEWHSRCCHLMGAYYAASRSFNTADTRFQSAIQPHIEKFDLESLKFTLEKIEKNSQTYGRGRSESDHTQFVNRISRLDKSFDYSDYPHFQRLVETIS